ncbi:MAG TPA: MFS transporter [Acidimicrobiia bacterium]|nr:MFS transporter [Acidimicrobiia bacterium]
MKATWRPGRLSVASWAIYDLANTIFALGVGSLFFAEWLTENQERLPDLPAWLSRGDPADLALTVAVDTAMIVVIVLGPWIGARSDHRGTRLRYLLPMTVLAVVPTFFLASVGVVASLALFSVALIGFNLGSVVYDALLPDVSTPDNVGVVSGVGIAVGYLGSFIAVAVGYFFLDSQGFPTVFRIIAVLFTVFAIPTFLWVRERPRRREPGDPPSLRSSVRRLIASWRRARHHDGVARFLVGRFLYTDAINTLIGGYLTIYAKEELGFTSGELQALLTVAITAAIIGGFSGGRLVDRVGPRRLLHSVLYAWMAAMVVGIIAGGSGTKALAWPLGGLGGLALGATWAADRVYMQRISPPRYLGEFYGLYATVGRFATLLGPLTWGLIVTVGGLPREFALGALVVFLLAGRLVLQGVDDMPRRWQPADLVPE